MSNCGQVVITPIVSRHIEYRGHSFRDNAKEGNIRNRIAAEYQSNSTWRARNGASSYNGRQRSKRKEGEEGGGGRKSHKRRLCAQLLLCLTIITCLMAIRNFVLNENIIE